MAIAAVAAAATVASRIFSFLFYFYFLCVFFSSFHCNLPRSAIHTHSTSAHEKLEQMKESIENAIVSNFGLVFYATNRNNNNFQNNKAGETCLLCLCLRMLLVKMIVDAVTSTQTYIRTAHTYRSRYRFS